MIAGYFDQPSAPLVSVVWCGKNRHFHAQRTIRSVLNQSYRRFELIVEDGASTDGTLEWLQDLTRSDERVSIVSRPSDDEGSALMAALRRCSGDYIVVCTPGHEFKRDALQVAVEAFAQSPDAGALAFKGLLRDRDGMPAPMPFDLVAMLFAPLRLALANGFIRRQALLISGLHDEGWRTASLRLDLWTRLAMDHQIETIDHEITAVTTESDIGSGFPIDTNRVLVERIAYVGALFSPDGFFGDDDDTLRNTCLANQLGLLREEYGHLTDDLLEPHIRELASSLTWLLLNERRTGLAIWRLLMFWAAYRNKLAPFGYRCVWRLFGDLNGRRIGPLLVFLSKHAEQAAWRMLRLLLTAPSKAMAELDDEAVAVALAPIYALVADRHHEHGQIENALKFWRKAEVLLDSNIEGTTLQAILKLSSATEQSIAELHARWADRNIGRRSPVDPTSLTRGAGGRRLRIGYHCSFMSADTMRYMMASVVAAHDHDQFEIYGYSPRPVPQDIARGFDVLRDTSTSHDDPSRKMFQGRPAIGDKAFLDLVRSDQLDVFVELSGFSPGHRFVAMASRCAPVQVSFMNHTASSQVVNVDYILADETGIPSGQQAERYYSEKIYRLPGCFFCFDYRIAPHPEVSPPPSIHRKFITFGSFGFGGKFNNELLKLWADLLHGTPGSRLWLQNNQMDVEFRRLLLGKFRHFGIAADRVTLAAGADRSQLLEVFRQIDISLDTWPYCGGNTLAESLWMGVPVITLKGDRFSSRYGASLLAAAGCGDLVAGSPSEYIALASRLAADPARLVFLRNNLREMSLKHGLGDSALFARRLEAAYREMLDPVLK